MAVEKYSLASSIKRNGRRLVAVGSGFETKSERSRESSKLLIYGLTNFDLVQISKKDEPFYLSILLTDNSEIAKLNK